MASFTKWMMLALLLSTCDAILGEVGICYGTKGDNLPPPEQVVSMYKQHNVTNMRIFAPDPTIQQALSAASGDGCVYLVLGTLNADITPLAQSPDSARLWVQTNVAPYDHACLYYVTVGNEAVPGPDADNIAPAMRNLRAALDEAGLTSVRVSTVVHSVVLGTSFPPSESAFSDMSSGAMTAILQEIASNPGTKLMVNVYPYHAYVSDPTNIRIDYAQFTATGPVVSDNGLEYSNLFDAMVDSFYSAMERAGAGGIEVIVSESGWPSEGNEFSTPAMALTYNANFRAKINSNNGTPKRPNQALQAFVFAMFNENLKPEGTERNFGLFLPDGTPVYPFF